MATITVYNKEGKESGTMDVSDAVFGQTRNDALVHQVAFVQSGNSYSGSAHTKDKGDRRGSGIKPWKQKGTGRARTGSVRNPIWRKGGVIFGPQKDSHTNRSINVKMRRQALRIVLSEKLRANEIVVVDALDTENPKTKDMNTVLKNLVDGKKALVCLHGDETVLYKSLRNIEGIKSTPVLQTNVLLSLSVPRIVLSKDAVTALEKHLEEK